ncbi:MAG TPA: ribbon-helix-helix protein, CopG family [Geobacteraceae bacterium]
MGKMKEFPRYNVVSLRVTDEEMKFLKQKCEKENTTCSQLIREILSSAGFPLRMIAEDEKIASPSPCG